MSSVTPPVPAPRSNRSSLASPPAKETDQLDGEKATELNEYSSCRFRFDINVSTNDGPCPKGDHEILMELTAKDGKKQVLHMDTRMLGFLHEQLEKVEQAFPRCYVYKMNKEGTS